MTTDIPDIEPSKSTADDDLRLELSDDELDDLDDFLARKPIKDTSMDVATLDGFITAITIGPRFIRPSGWVPWVWDMYDAKATPEFGSEDEANYIMALLMRHYNGIVQLFNEDPEVFEPICFQRDYWGAAEWCEGFLMGFMFDEEAWTVLSVGQPKWFAPFLRLGTPEGNELIRNADDADKWVGEIAESLVKIHAYWKDKRGQRREQGFIEDDFDLGRRSTVTPFVREQPKVGRNDPCPCGSGKKFKKCCGAGGGTSVLP